MDREYAVSTISRCAVLAGLLEVSASPKPGNVHRLRDFGDTRFEHFLAGNIALAPLFRESAGRGHDLREGLIGFEDIRIGELIYESSNQMSNWQSGGNVNLGIILLFVPLTVAAGYVFGKSDIDIGELRRVLKIIIRNTTSEDASFVFKTIKKSMTEKTLGQVKELNVNDEKSLQMISKNGLNLREIFRFCEKRDMICYEWTSDFDITFNHSYPYIEKQIIKKVNINTATINTFLYILSEYPDSLIIRKSGLAKAHYVSQKAKKILEEDGYSTDVGREMVWNLDRELHEADGMLNPGTSADLTASSIYLLLLGGWRP